MVGVQRFSKIYCTVYLILTTVVFYDCDVRSKVNPRDAIRFSLTRYSKRTHIWGEQGTHTQYSNIIERNNFGGPEVLVCGSIMLGICTSLHIFQEGLLSSVRSGGEIFVGEWLYATHGLALKVSELKSLRTFVRLSGETHDKMPEMIPKLQLAWQEEWLCMPQQLLDNLVLNINRHCKFCIAISIDCIPY